MTRVVMAAMVCCGVAMAGAPANDVEHNQKRAREFAAFQPHYEEWKAQRVATMRTLAARVEERERARASTLCSHQILWELKLLVGTTADFRPIDRRIRDLEFTLAHPEREAAAERQNPKDGSWGVCYDSWVLKLSASYDHAKDEGTRPFRFLDRVNSPEKLTAYLSSVATSDITRTGVDRTFEFNEALADLMRLILRDRPKEYRWDPRLKQTLMDLILHRFRNQETGWWGVSYVRDGQVKFVDDLSITFHVVTFLDGKVPDLGKVIETALALKEVDTPTGWLWKGAYWNHNNMDVGMLFGYGWPGASEAQRQALRVELGKMLRWCLSESLQADGSFVPIVADGSLEETNYFGAAFLARIGYFDRARRFWTEEEFPEADGVKRRIVDLINANLKTGGAGGEYYRTILEELRTGRY